MFYIQTLLFAMLGFISSSVAMEAAPAHPGQEGQIQAVEGSDYLGELVKLRQKISRAISSYSAYLPSSLGCNWCQSWHEFFNTEEYQHYIKRKKQLDTIDSIIKNKIWMPQEVLSYIDNSMSPFGGLISSNFEQTCKDEIKDFIKKYSLQLSDDNENCVVCGDEKASVFNKSCGHLSYCQGCFGKLSENRKRNCPICWQDITQFIEIKSVDLSEFCALCGVARPNVFSSCNHMVICDGCLKDKKPTNCPRCKRVYKDNQKVHFCGPHQ